MRPVGATVVPDGWHPDDARTRFYECDVMFTDEELTLHGSVITMRDMLTATMARVLYMAEINTLHDLPGASLSSVLDTWRQWQRGQRVWRDPSVGTGEVPSAMEALLDPDDWWGSRWGRGVGVFFFQLTGVGWQLLLLGRRTAVVGVCQTPGLRVDSSFRCSGSSFRFGLQIWAVGLALVIMPGNLGVYATESLSAASAPESAYTAMGEMSRQRAGQWREQHGLLSDSDFAFSFQSYEEAMAQAGTLVAEEWAAEEAKPSDDHVEALTEALHCLGSMRPRGDLTVGLEREWRAALQRKAEAKAREAEAATVRGALLTFSELQIHMTDRGRAFPPDGVDLDAFLYGVTAAQSRALAGLRWLVKAGQLEHDLSAYDFRGIEQLYNSNNPQWSTFHFHCSKGKQRGNRNGFDYAVPSYFMSGWDWSTHWLEDWRALPVLSRQNAGINFNEFGQHVQLQESGPFFRYVGWLVPPAAVVAGGLAGCHTPAPGGQFHAPSVRQHSLHGVTVRRKHCLINAVASLVRFTSWDEVTQEALEAAERDGALGMDRAVQKDNHTVWQGQLSPEEIQPRFRLPAAVPVPAAAAAMMLRQIGGKRLSAILRDGVQLCAAFQAGHCRHQGDECSGGRHRCAILLQSGRVCGGTHGAGVCRVKRFVKAPESPPRTGTRAKAGAVVLKLKTKTIQVKAMPKSRGALAGSGSSSSDLPPLKRHRVAQEPAHPPPRSSASASASGSGIPEPATPPRSRPVQPSTPPPRRAASSPPRVSGRTGGRRDRQDDAAESRALERHFDSIATIGGKRIQPPTKLWESREGGTLWLSGMPTAETLHAYPRCDLQLSWLTESLTSRGGAIIPGALQMQVAITDARSRDRQWKECWPVIRQTLVSGGSVLGHCVAGRHRAATGQALLLALLTDVPFEQATAYRYVATAKDKRQVNASGIVPRFKTSKKLKAINGVVTACSEHRQYSTQSEVITCEGATSGGIWRSFQPEESTDLSDQAELPSVSPAMASFSLVPRDGADFRATMESLQLNFEFSDDVLEALVKQKIKNLEEFRYFFESEGEIGLWVQKLSLGDQQPLQTARLRRTWAAVKVFFQHADAGRVPDLDDLLDDSSLRDMKQQFWRRYKTRFPPELYPSDATLSRVTRELNKRMLCVFSVWKVKSLQFQLLSTSKKRKLGDNLYTEDQDQDEVIPRDCESYLDRLQILLTAYALAGVQPVAGSPPANGENTVGSDTTQFVHAPLDVLMEYFHRAKRSVSQVQGPKTLSWLQHKDNEERAVWVSKFRESTKTLGAVVREVLDLRDAHWIPVQSGSASEALSASPAKPPQGGAPQPPPKPSSFALGKSVNGKKVAQMMKDGKRLCQDYQEGRCARGKQCPDLHRCGVVLKGERVCGSAKHGASQCKQKAPASPRSIPVMADLFSGPNAPLSKAFLFCGWQCLPVDLKLDSSHDLANPLRQSSLAAQLQQVDFIAAAFDCSTKSRARDIPRSFEDGRPAPRPLRSASCPEGLGGLSKAEQERVDKDNRACSFVLDAIQQAAEKGVGSVRENPANSLHWLLPQEVQSFQSGLWQDKHYDACCWGGARYKRQRLRHNLQEIADWPAIQCHHIHGKGEWDPQSVDGKHWFPSQEEAEYTAPLAFAIAVSASWWAARVGRAKLAVPRMPVPGCVGRREAWTSFDPRALRAWAMAPLAISLGLTPPEEANRIPQRRAVAEIQREDGLLPPGAIYIGQGHHSHRLPRTKWAAPMVAGHDCSFDEFLPRYVQHIKDNLGDQLPELFGKTLVVDEITAWPSEGDALAGLVFEELSDRNMEAKPLQRRPPNKKRRSSQIGRPLRALGLAVAPLADASQIFSCYLRQEDVFGAVCKLFPAEWLEGVTFPFLEDLINAPPFDLYTRWLRDSGADWTGPCGPTLAPQSARIFQRAAGQQAGALSQRAALPPLLSFGLSEEDHFCHSLARLHEPVPTEREPILDPDLRFAADFTAANRTSLRSLRQNAIGAVRELKRRWAPVDVALRRFQAPSLHRVTAARDIGLVALLVVLFSWPDTALPFALVVGMPAVGFAPCYGVFPQLPTSRISFDEVMGDWRAHNARMLSRIGPSKDDVFLLQQSTKDHEAGFCSPPLTEAALLRRLKGRPYRLIPRCVITQSSGKQRIIDNADAGGQSETSYDSNKLVLCSALRPGQHAQAIVARVPPEDLEEAKESDSLESGGEDWPDAYRHCPMSEEESLACLVVWWHHEWQAPAYQIYAGLLFGLPLAVTSFNRYSRFSEAASRRLALTVASSYFDDFNLLDWASSKGSGQWAVGSINTLLGTPFAAEKRQPMSAHGTFLGLDHVLSEALSQGFVTFWARERLFDKMADLIEQATSSGSLQDVRPYELLGARDVWPGGFLIVWQHPKGEKKIAQLELSMVLYALVSRPSHFRSRRGVWYIDNTAALMSLIRGRSDNADLSRLAQLIHLCLFCFKTWVYWEWVPSKSNWSDSISREGADDVWHQSHLFSTFRAHFPHELWALPLEAVVVVLEFL
ncbi:unnamed protein product [Symbiodinium sp. CCMP2592]|nr:unnamed protein product [Symbiodinium sp. CCMP2592]